MQDSETDIFAVEVFLGHKSKIWRSRVEDKGGVGHDRNIYTFVKRGSRLSRNLPQTARTNYTKPYVKWIIICARIFPFLNLLSELFLMVIKHGIYRRMERVVAIDNYTT